MQHENHCSNIVYFIQMISRLQRCKSLFDQRKTRRSQVFHNHRLHHFLASNDQVRVQFQAIYEHLDSICSHSMEQKFSAFLVVMLRQQPQMADFIRIGWTSKLIDQFSNDLDPLLSSVCYCLNEITINYLFENEFNFNVYIEHNNPTFRLNVNSISSLLAELLSRLLTTFSNRCNTTKLHITKEILDAFELCYEKSICNRDVIERNVHSIFTLIQGRGRFERANAIVQRHTLIERLMYHHNNESDNSLIVLKIFNGITKGFPENINTLLELNVLGYLHNQLNASARPSYQQVEEGLCILENICGNHRSDIQAVIDADLIPPLIDGNF